MTAPRILILSDLWLPFPGGAERLIFNLSRYLAQSGFDVGVLTGYEHAQQFDGPRVCVAAIGDGQGDPGWATVAEHIAMFGPQVIVTHHHYARLFEEPLIGTGIPLVQIVLNGYRIPEAAMAVYISEHVRAASGAGDFPLDQVITPPAFGDVVAESHGDGIGFIKPIPHKGVDLIYRLARALPDERFVILRGEWQDLEVIEQHLNVEFMEPVDDIREFWARVRMVLVPSISEDAGTVAQEATLNGVPCISSDVGGLAETNAGGIRVAIPALPLWCEQIRALDNPAWSAAVVASMRTAYDACDHLGALASFAESVRKIAAG